MRSHAPGKQKKRQLQLRNSVVVAATTTHSVVVVVAEKHNYHFMCKPFNTLVRLNNHKIKKEEIEMNETKARGRLPSLTDSTAPEFVRISKAAKEIYGCTTQNLYKQIIRGNLKVYERFGR